MKLNISILLMFMMAFGLGLGLTSCGSSDDGNKESTPAPTEGNGDQSGEDGSEEDEGEGDDRLGAGEVQDGKYYMSAGSYEAFDTSGNKIDAQTLQITGDYTWIVEFQGEDKYELTATGSAKISANNEVLAEVNCIGSQDVYSFELTSSGALRGFQVLEAGCPQESQINAAQQMSIKSLNDSSFSYTAVTQNDGTRVIETYTFRK